MDPSFDYIKRVIGVPGDMIAYQNKRLTINGVAVPTMPVADYLHRERAAFNGDLVHNGGTRRGVDDARLAHAGCGPAADDGIRTGQEADRHLQDERRDVGILQVVRLGGRITERHEVHEIENLAQVYDERVLALSDEHAAERTVGQANFAYMCSGIRSVVRQRLVPDVVDGLGERRRTRSCIDDIADHAGAPVAEHDLDRVALEQV